MPLALRIYVRANDRRKQVAERVLEDERITVGRSAECTLSLEDPNRYLSRLQAEFERGGRGYVMRVLSRTLPVVVNGVSYGEGSEVMVRAGDVVSMDAYDLEIVSASPASPAPAPRPRAAVAPPPQPDPATPARRAPVEVRVQEPGPASGRVNWLRAGGAVVAVALLAALWPALKGALPDGEAQKRAEQAVARLEGEARSVLKLAEGDRREFKEAAAASVREVERIEAAVRSARTSVERMSFDAALAEARRMARASAKAEERVREHIEGPSGLPRAEGNLNAATAAARGGDRTEALRLLEETVGGLAALRAKVGEERRTLQADQYKHREQVLAAETRAIAEAESRTKAEAEARAKAKARAEAEAEARARAEADKVKAAGRSAPAPSKPASGPLAPAAAPATPAPPAAAVPAPEKPAPVPQAPPAPPAAASPCLEKLAGAWAHPAGGTWTFDGNRATRVVDSVHYGPRAQEITVLSVQACDSDNLTYRIVREALVNTGNPVQAFDKTPSSDPSRSTWGKVYVQRYAISAAGLRFGNYTFGKK